MKTTKINAKSFRNIHEMKLLKQKLEFQEKLLEKEITGSFAAIFDSFTNSLRNISYQFGFQLLSGLYKSLKKRRNRKRGE